jgi:muramidase (phage lysozyme)
LPWRGDTCRQNLCSGISFQLYRYIYYRHIQRVGEIPFSHKHFDVNHINDLFIHNNRMFISMFSHTIPWRETDQNSGVILEYSLLGGKQKCGDNC